MASRPNKIISSGESGACIGGLKAAHETGVKTGGWAPLGFNTEDGPQPDILLGTFHLKELENTEGISHRHIVESDATVIFTLVPAGDDTSRLVQLCNDEKHHYALIRPSGSMAQIDLTAFLERHQPLVLHIAGDRESVSPGIGDQVRQLLVQCLTSD